MSKYTEELVNAPTTENQTKVRDIISKALEMQHQLWSTNPNVKFEPAVIDVLAYMHDKIAGTKRVLYSLPEYVGDNYSALYHLAHAKPLHGKVIKFLEQELKFLSPEEK